ncbi:GntR family transcriptional regulator [Streptomyces sp. NBC_01549]|uniref:GntR family transcriptional regulator n=1 Tax=Streptomyces sp. NBC_01549 TaxID=2975874 RepID=UPI0022539735|nr:GntR family transcriptional regulator [Streptomyces sp. NBC_01549]MCX4596737.1 GntR family transcriptional regulator [Streptomyces sp. NBC_01549]
MVDMSSRQQGSSRVVEVYRQIRSDILSARLRPGQRLKVSPLCDRFSVSLSVVREALTRLSAEGLVRSEPQLGFSVIPLDRPGLVDLTNVRVELETLALRWAIEKGDLEWESRVVGALHKLGRTEFRVPGAASQVSEAWSTAHAELHEALASGCGSPLLMELRQGPYDAAEVYRRWTMPAQRGKRDIHGEHTAIVNAAMSRDADLAAELLEQHLRQTTEILLTSDFLIADEESARPDASESVGDAPSSADTRSGRHPSPAGPPKKRRRA